MDLASFEIQEIAPLLAGNLSQNKMHKNGGIGVCLVRLLKDDQLHAMKKKHRRLLLVAIGMGLVAGFLLPPFSVSRRPATHIQSVNHLASVSFPISTNLTASQQHKTP